MKSKLAAGGVLPGWGGDSTVTSAQIAAAINLPAFLYPAQQPHSSMYSFDIFTKVHKNAARLQESLDLSNFIIVGTQRTQVSTCLGR
jgi:hypothetical protein